MAFTGLATKVYKDPITTVYLNSIKQDLDYLITGVSKTFVSFDGTSTGPTGVTGQNISTVTRSSLGTWKITFSSGYSSRLYNVASFCHNIPESNITSVPSGVSALTTTSITVRSVSTANVTNDAIRVNVSIIGVIP